MNRILFCSSEVYPFCKTGGLGDLAGALPKSLNQIHQDVRIVLPGYRQVLNQCSDAREIASIQLEGSASPVALLETLLPGTRVPVYLVDCKEAFDRDGGLYVNEYGQDWSDNARRFCLFARAIVELAMNRSGINWQPDIVHCNDWQTGLIPALLLGEAHRPATIFSIHNLAYQGTFSWEEFQQLSLPQALWAYDSMEQHGRFSFIKGGLSHADILTTVSPTYALEIMTEEYGCGLQELLRYRSDKLTGILNGIDEETWNPATDPLLLRNYTAADLSGKYYNKRALQRQLGLSRSARKILVSHIGRLGYQKGTDLILDILPQLMAMDDVQLVILGSGDRHLEHALQEASQFYPGKLAVRIAYDEKLAHRIEAGSDLFLMPSRYEPCGLNQMYSMTYGTVPVVRLTGGLADSVDLADDTSMVSGTATGFGFREISGTALLDTVNRALQLYRHSPDQWQGIVKAAMSQQFGWRLRAASYVELYQQLIAGNNRARRR